MRKQGGYTTVELVIALGVVAIVLVVCVLFVRSARAGMRDAVRISDIKQVQAGLELYFNEQYSYPVVTGPVAVGGANAQCMDGTGFASRCGSGRVYMPLVPGNVDGNPYAYISLNNEDVACTTSPCVKYALQFELEASRGTLAEGPNCARPEGIKPGACQ